MSTPQQDKKEQKKDILKIMIEIYCNNHHDSTALCADCRQLLFYGYERIENCTQLENYFFCSNCEVNCFEGNKREEIRQVMKYSGPRLIFHRPDLVVKYLAVKLINVWNKLR